MEYKLHKCGSYNIHTIKTDRIIIYILRFVTKIMIFCSIIVKLIIYCFTFNKNIFFTKFCKKRFTNPKDGAIILS